MALAWVRAVLPREGLRPLIKGSYLRAGGTVCHLTCLAAAAVQAQIKKAVRTGVVGARRRHGVYPGLRGRHGGHDAALLQASWRDRAARGGGPCGWGPVWGHVRRPALPVSAAGRGRRLCMHSAACGWHPG